MTKHRTFTQQAKSQGLLKSNLLPYLFIYLFIYSGQPEDSLSPNFPTEVFEDKTAMFSCTGYPGYPDGQIMWRIKHENETAFRNFDFYSQYSNISDDNCRRKEINNVPFQFDMSWNNTMVKCYIETTDYFAEGQIRLLPCKYFNG